ncbi:Rab11 [Hexamita inflata]|uniref:Rab11 n=1 Tax=Hexamita inflata TaxID=28002 RepID=A0AA86NGL7_9EUKA|nr:Rab11 [Hexamita inflata]CAI9928010.1 Rab11 [Hexamita inflata]CAI9930085.1 Rab11 [Hexamita inflata]
MSTTEVDNGEIDFTIKTALIGDSAVGKTSFVRRMSKNQFHQSEVSTIGMDIYQCTIKTDANESVQIIMYDTAGQERFRALAPSSIKSADLVLLMFDVSKKQTYESITTYWNEIVNKNSADSQKLLVGNKADLDNIREVSKDECISYAQDNNMTYCEISCRTGEFIGDLIKEIVKCRRSKTYLETRTDVFSIAEVDKQKKPKSCC